MSSRAGKYLDQYVPLLSLIGRLEYLDRPALDSKSRYFNKRLPGRSMSKGLDYTPHKHSGQPSHDQDKRMGMLGLAQSFSAPRQ